MNIADGHIPNPADARVPIALFNIYKDGEAIQRGRIVAGLDADIGKRNTPYGSAVLHEKADPACCVPNGAVRKMEVAKISMGLGADLERHAASLEGAVCDDVSAGVRPGRSAYIAVIPSDDMTIGDVHVTARIWVNAIRIQSMGIIMDRDAVDEDCLATTEVQGLGIAE